MCIKNASRFDVPYTITTRTSVVQSNTLRFTYGIDVDIIQIILYYTVYINILYTVIIIFCTGPEREGVRTHTQTHYARV